MASPDVSVLMDLEGWPDDAARFLASLRRHRGRNSIELITVDRREQAESPVPALFDSAAPVWDGPASYLAAPPEAGFGAVQNMALAAATGAVVVLVDTSLELTGDLLGVLAAVLVEDPTVAVAGPFGLATRDLCDYEERSTGEVAAVQGYCLAVRRADLVAAGGVKEAFTWYRNADIDVSLRLRTLREPLRRAVAVGAEHCRRHTHRAWEATPEAERAERSRHNMGIVHEVFFGRNDLTVP